ncbi:MAG: serine/threonine protein kinase [Saprospiraceae bacterium]|nr:serine/threonine protein kinase [Saprospiraceae bacterium]
MMEPGNRIDTFTLKRLIGNGGFSTVWEVEDTLGRQFAMKISNSDPFSRRTAELIIQEEYFRSKDLVHPNLLIPIGYQQKEDGFSYVVMPLCKCSLMDEINSRKLKVKSKVNGIFDPLFSELEIASLIHDISDALVYLKQNGIVHKDIKPDNIMIMSQGARVKFLLADFGISENHSVSNLSRETVDMNSKNQGISKAYAPPEIFKGQVNSKTDIFSLGVTLFEMITGNVPFENQGKVYGENSKNSKKNVFDECPIEVVGILKQIINVCLQFDPKERPSPEELTKWGNYFLENNFWLPIKRNSEHVINARKISAGLIVICSLIVLIVGSDYLFHNYKVKLVNNLISNGELKKARAEFEDTKFWFFSSNGLQEKKDRLDQILASNHQNYSVGNGFLISVDPTGTKQLLDQNFKILASGSISEIIPLTENVFLIQQQENNQTCPTCWLVGSHGALNAKLTNNTFERNEQKFSCRLAFKNSDESIFIVDCEGLKMQLTNLN